MNNEEDNILDINEEFWDLNEHKVIWDGVPRVNETIYKFLMGILIAAFLFCCAILSLNFSTLTTEDIIIFLLLASMFGIVIACVMWAIHDVFRKKRKAKYVLLNDYLVIRAGDRLTTKGFRFTHIEKVFCKPKSKYISVVLKNKIWNPFSFLKFRTKTLKLGPLENAEGIAELLDDHIRNEAVDYSKYSKNNSDKLKELGVWKNANVGAVWEGKPLVNHPIYIFVITLEILLLVILFLYIYMTNDSSDLEGIFVSMIGISLVFCLPIFIYTYESYRNVIKTTYILKEQFLFVKKGYKSYTTRFDLSSIVNGVYLEENNNKVIIALKEQVSYQKVFYKSKTDKIALGPFEKPKEVLNIIKNQMSAVNN